MAESVKRRVAAAKLAVAFVAAGAIAGAAYAQAGPTPPTAKESILVSSIKANSIKSENIVNGSLLFQDFKSGQVPSEKQFIKLQSSYKNFHKAAIKNYLSKTDADKLYIKSENNGFIKGAEADARYIKLTDAVVRGDGSVHTASALLPTGSNTGVPLLDVSNLVGVEGSPGSQFKVTNKSGGPLTHSSCGVGGAAGTLQPGGSVVCDANGTGVQTLQLVGSGANPTVMTLNFSSLPVTGGSQDTVQILIGL